MSTTITTVEYVQHWHAYSSMPGYLPEVEPCMTDDPGQALDFLAHLITDWVEAQAEQPEDLDQPEPGELARAREIAEQCCWCEASSDPKHDRLLAQVNEGEGLCEYLGRLCFDITPCQDLGCMKCCPDPDCRTVTATTDVDVWCWVCGARYVTHDSCAWIA